MPRYVARACVEPAQPRASLARDDLNLWGEGERVFRDVIVTEAGPRWSGLYDAEGRALYRAQDRVPCGFHHAEPKGRT